MELLNANTARVINDHGNDIAEKIRYAVWADENELSMMVFDSETSAMMSLNKNMVLQLIETLNHYSQLLT